jgi:hypothetical protein
MYSGFGPSFHDTRKVSNGLSGQTPEVSRPFAGKKAKERGTEDLQRIQLRFFTFALIAEASPYRQARWVWG